jgi:transcriptional regulatory protein LevR
MCNGLIKIPYEVFKQMYTYCPRITDVRLVNIKKILNNNGYKLLSTEFGEKITYHCMKHGENIIIVCNLCKSSQEIAYSNLMKDDRKLPD